MKTCSKCKESKDFSEFGNDKSRRDGLSPQCKECRADYSKNLRKTNSLTIEPVPPSLVCGSCREGKPSSKFYNKKGNKFNKDNFCIKCRKSYMKKYIDTNIISIREGAKKRQQKYRKPRIKELRAWFNDLKNKPCLDCGNSFPSVCMDFDHVEGKKINEVSKLVSSLRTKEEILREISKCELVCANCHRIRTHSRNVSRKLTRKVN